MNRRHFLLLLVIIALFVLVNDADAQCAMCKKVAEGKGPNSTSVARSLNPAILYLMSVPYFALMFIFRKQIGGAWRSWRGKKKPS
jgi:hypothetical protein